MGLGFLMSRVVLTGLALFGERRPRGPVGDQATETRSREMSYGRSLELDLPFDEAVPKVKEAFHEQGFGTLTEIDVRATLRENLGQEMEGYLILGACNPQLAHRALEVEREIGLLLPCNVVVRERGGRTLVQALDPEIMVRVPGREELKPIAEEASRRIDAALGKLQEACS
jgi:uncharacterized protein (DUF302 family)